MKELAVERTGDWPEKLFNRETLMGDVQIWLNPIQEQDLLSLSTQPSKKKTVYMLL